MFERASIPRMAGLLVSLLASAASAQTVTFNVSLDGSQETPPVTTTGTGMATVTLDVATRNVSVSGTYSMLLGNQTLAHIHGPAPRGMMAGILIGLTGTGGKSGSFSGSGVLSVANVNNLGDNLLYLNIHTSMFSAGEIRGQIEKPGSSVLCNGTGTNPVILSDTSATTPAPTPPGNSPVIGKNWRVTLDCSPNGTIGSFAIFRVGFAPKPPPMSTQWGEILVPISAGTGQSFLESVPASRVVDLGPVLLPDDASFLGMTFSVQGFCPASPIGYLGNALAETVGTL